MCLTLHVKSSDALKSTEAGAALFLMDEKRHANKLAQREFRRRKKDYVTKLENFLVAEFGRDILERTPGTRSHQSIVFGRLEDKVRKLKQVQRDEG